MSDLNHQALVEFCTDECYPTSVNRWGVTERAYISDKETWAIFVGNWLDPIEFIRHYDNIHDAIDNYVADTVWDEPTPSWLEDSLRDYILAYLA